MGILGEMDQNHRRDMQLYNSIFSLLCYEKIGFTGSWKQSWYSLWFVTLPFSPTYPLTSFAVQFFHLSVHAEVQFRPYRTDDFITRLYYETPRFTVLNQTWVLKARVNDSERNPNLSCKRTLSFQLILKSKVHTSLTVCVYFEFFCLCLFRRVTLKQSWWYSKDMNHQKKKKSELQETPIWLISDIIWYLQYVDVWTK